MMSQESHLCGRLAKYTLGSSSVSASKTCLIPKLINIFFKSTEEVHLLNYTGVVLLSNFNNNYTNTYYTHITILHYIPYFTTLLQKYSLLSNYTHSIPYIAHELNSLRYYHNGCNLHCGRLFPSFNFF